MSGPLPIDALLAGAMAECGRIERALRAAELEGVGVLLVRDARGSLVEAFVCDDVPAGRLVEADGPLLRADPPAVDVQQSHPAAGDVRAA